MPGLIRIVHVSPLNDDEARMKKNLMTYAGFNEDTHGMTVLGWVVLDGWLFGFSPSPKIAKARSLAPAT